MKPPKFKRLVSVMPVMCPHAGKLCRQPRRRQEKALFADKSFRRRNGAEKPLAAPRRKQFLSNAHYFKRAMVIGN
jgi:hypothetical protein